MFIAPRSDQVVRCSVRYQLLVSVGCLQTLSEGTSFTTLRTPEALAPRKMSGTSSVIIQRVELNVKIRQPDSGPPNEQA
jgi:hypothetical protein